MQTSRLPIDNLEISTGQSINATETNTGYGPGLPSPHPCPKSWMLIFATHLCWFNRVSISHWEGERAAFFPPSRFLQMDTHKSHPQNLGGPCLLPRAPDQTTSGTSGVEGWETLGTQWGKGPAWEPQPLPSPHLPPADSLATHPWVHFPGCPSLHPATPTSGMLWPPPHPTV